MPERHEKWNCEYMWLIDVMLVSLENHVNEKCKGLLAPEYCHTCQIDHGDSNFMYKLVCRKAVLEQM